MAKLPPIEIQSSRTRLLALAIFALFCFAAGLLNLTPLFSGEAEFTFWVYVFMGLCGLFLVWCGLSAWVALSQPKVAYRFAEEGVYLGNQPEPAFTWDQVKGATLARGKRRSSVVVVLDDPGALNRAGLLPDWLATFLGRPTDKDLALTNMDTAVDLATFLDLIGPYFHTYGGDALKEGP